MRIKSQDFYSQEAGKIVSYVSSNQNLLILDLIKAAFTHN